MHREVSGRVDGTRNRSACHTRCTESDAVGHARRGGDDEAAEGR